MGAEAAFMPSGLVLVNQSPTCHAIDDGHRRFESGLRLCLISGCNRSIHFLEVGAQHGTPAGIMFTTFFRLADTLSGLC